jgi:hypothetical protein
MVLIDVEVSFRPDPEVEAAVAREELEHVVEKSDTGPHVVSSSSVERQPDRDRGLGRLPLD